MNRKLPKYVAISEGFEVSKFYIDYSLKGKKFAFSFHAKSCREVASGTCSVAPLKAFDSYDHDITDKANEKHCPLILIRMRENPVIFFPIWIWRYKCGHFSIGSNTHRVCITGKIEATLPKVYVGQTKSKLPCGYCRQEPEYKLVTF